MNYIKRYQNTQALSVSVGTNSLEDQLMHTFLDKFHQGGKYSSLIASHKVELRREGKVTDQKYLSSSSLQTDYINIDISSGCGENSDKANIFQTKCTFCGGANHSTKQISK